MALHRELETFGRRHLRRRCVQCGLADAGAAGRERCPRCRCDLAARPPKSYAEMEGLFELAEPRPHADYVGRVRADAAAARWLAVVGLVGLASVATLAAAILVAGAGR